MNIIEENVNDADKAVVIAKKNINDTRNIQKSKNKWLWIGLSVVAIIAVILICVFTL